ncbi:MAG: cation acetate symporter, partial [Verrucomicrobiota bacterium]
MKGALLGAVDPWILGWSLMTVLVTLALGYWAAGKARTASDFFVAGRGVSVGWNASAISGEYLSAASFMGVAGMVMSSGYDALWYPVCYACGYLFLLLFIAGPLRRFGAYTIPDFAEGRYDSPLFRKIAVLFVLFIGFFYTMPQMKGAGTTLAYIFQSVDLRGGWLDFMAPRVNGVAMAGFPYWAGVVVVGAVITLNVALGGMKGITLVQAFQYWAKMFAISVPIFVLMSVVGFYNQHVAANVAPGEAASVAGVADPGYRANPGHTIERKPLPEKAPKDQAWIAPFGPLTTKAVNAAAAALPAEQRAAYLAEHQRPYSLLYTYSLIIALVCGTAGLPHILVRFYTNPDGVAAKRTTMWVMILIG